MRIANERRLFWLDSDLNKMTAGIMEDVTHALHQQKMINPEKLLEEHGITFKDQVTKCIRDHVTSFQGKIDDVLRENQKLLKAKLPKHADRGIQTENWSMQDALEEIDELKRRKWLAERETRDLNAKLADKT